MDRALVVVEPGEGKTDLVARAAALADGVGAELSLLTVIPVDVTVDRISRPPSPAETSRDYVDRYMPESEFQDRQAAFSRRESGVR